jgi:hypothetical protein
MAKFNINDVLFTSVDTIDVFTPMFGADVTKGREFEIGLVTKAD